MTAQLEEVICELLTRNKVLRFRISAVEAAPDLSSIDVVVHFLAGHSYCCAEGGCHFPWTCDRLIKLAAAHSICLPENVIVRWHCNVEEGARLQCHAALGQPAESRAYQFEDISPRPRTLSEPKPPPDFTGLWTTHHSYGGRSEDEYVNGVKNGVFRRWDKNGVCRREGFGKEGKYHGQLIIRNSDGTVLDESVFDEGTGIYRIFNSSGRLTDEIPMRHGRAHGTAKRWVNERLVELRYYVDGQCVGASYDPG
jgi:hypothetical protein